MDTFWASEDPEVLDASTGGTMGALPRPDLAPGPARELNDALHDLHHRAGWPSLRTLAHDAGCSHTTVSHVFSSPRLPTWGVVELLVEAMNGTTSSFHDLWLAASTPSTNGTSPTPRIAGRRSELIAVRRHLESGTGLLLVTGEAGIGKTTLVNAAATASTTLTATGHCLPLSAQTPLRPVLDVLRATIGSDGKRIKAALSESPAYVFVALARLLPELGLDPPDEPADEWARQRLLTAIRSVLVNLGTVEPFAVLVEDLHWADASTLDLLEHLVSTGAEVSLVGTWRDDPGTLPVNKAWFQRVRRTGDVVALALPPLTRDETAEQLAGHDPPLDVDAVYARTLGHPLYSAQIAAHQAEEGVPLELADLLDARLGHLDGNAWSLARVLAVADRRLTSDVLAQATGLDSETMASGLRVLAERHLLTAGHDGRSVGLGHPLLAEAVRRRLVPGERPETHRRLAVAIGTLREVQPAEVAVHWRQAGDPSNELRWRIRAAEAAHQNLAFSEEAEHWRRALDLWSGEPSSDLGTDRATIVLAAIDALNNAGHDSDVLSLADATLRASDDLPPDARFKIAMRAAAITWGQAGPGPALSRLDAAISANGGKPPREAVIDSLRLRASLLSKLGREQEALDALDEAVALSGRHNDPRTAFVLLATKLWHVGVSRGDLAGAMDLLDTARAVMPQDQQAQHETFLAMMCTDVLLHHARPAEEVERSATRALALIEEHGLRSTLANMVRANVAEGWVNAGRPTRADALLPEDTRTSAAFSNWPMRLIAAQVAVAAGRTGEALALYDQPYQRDDFADLGVCVGASSALLWVAEPGPALDRLVEVLERVAGNTTSKLAGVAFMTAARAAADLDPSEAARWRPRLLRLRERAAVDPLGPGRVPGTRQAATTTWRAELARIDRTDTIQLWATAGAEWDKIARPHDAAYCGWRAAQVALREGQATVATRLLKSAASGAREHVPLSRAIRATADGRS